MLKEKNKKEPACRPPLEESRFFREVNVEFLIHELKDPLSVIETAMRTLLEKREKFGPLSPRQEKTLKRALRNSRKAGAMLHSLLQVGSSEAMCFDCCRFSPVEAAVKALMDALETEAGKAWEIILNENEPEKRKNLLGQCGIETISTPAAESATMLQDESKFGHVAGNLIKNALRHRKDKVVLKMDCCEGFFMLDVIDDGPGIDVCNHEFIFQRYTRTKESAAISRTGHGLGLAGARIIARRLSGDITLKSAVGKGAAFQLKLPLVYDDKLS